MTLRKGLLAATMLALPMVANAQPVTGLYIGAGVGANWRMNDANTTVSYGGVSYSAGKIESQVGYVALGSIGWGFGNGLRAELEGNYRYNDGSGNAINVNRGPTNYAYGQGGHFATYGFMVNALYDFNVGLPITPYVGVGVGMAWNELGGYRQVARVGANTATSRINDTSSQFAYQAILGMAYSLGAMVPGLALTAEYRFFGTMDPEWAMNTTVTGANPGSTTSKVSVTNYNSSVLIGVRYNFGVAPPPPPPVAAVAPPPVARTFLVFFDWDRADLTTRAREIIGEAAAASRTTATTRIEVQGHADRSGSDAYNMRLSRRRADNVAAELVRRGVSRNIITIQAFGESRPLVPTADGVREPQNRRVEIILK